MTSLYIFFIYVLFLLSGAAALMYEVVWVRSMSLVFGGSHLAVTTTLSVFMAGLALGSFLIGRNISRFKNLLKLYALLELGIACFALIFAQLMRLYPSIYIPLAQIAPESPLFLSLIRIIFAFAALIVPTTLMGGTLPVLSSFVSSQGRDFGRHLSFLYGLNTFGAVLGTMAAGFFFLPRFSVSATLAIAVLINVAVGLCSFFLQGKIPAIASDGGTKHPAAGAAESSSKLDAAGNRSPFALVLWGIGVSGFCALGYEVLWTRILSIVIGQSVYGFTIMLVAFLSGIGTGSAAYGMFLRLSPGFRNRSPKTPAASVISFGLVQVLIGITAIFVTLYVRDLPNNSLFLQDYFLSRGMGLFAARQWASFALAFAYMFVPAFFMGVAFPMAGKVRAEYRTVTGRAVGEVMAYNTVGAILGAAVSGYFLVYLVGIERGAQILTLVNIGFGLLVIVSTMNKMLLNWGVSLLAVASILTLGVNPDIWRMWDRKYFAIFRNNQPEAFRTPELIRENLLNTDVLYYAEGVEAIVSAIKIRGGDQSFIVNGRTEASSELGDQQCQYTLGHLPMLLHKKPKKVFVLGTGSGMTLGATSVHPEVEQITLAEIEPKVLGIARTFSDFNHNVLSNPKLRIVFNDGRNFLMTTKEKFDVITADPVHPWFRGAGYLYTTEYFRLAAERLRPGGIICQWLPIYELTDDDLKSIVRTFRQNFKYTLMWLTYQDAEIVGSNSPILIDEAELARRMAEPEIARDLKRVMMGTAEDFLSYFVMGTAGMRAYGDGGTVNTDDNLFIEFSAPRSIGNASLMGKNAAIISRYRESILPYLVTPRDEVARARQRAGWEERERAARLTDLGQAITLGGGIISPEFNAVMAELDKKYPAYAPGRFLKGLYLARMAQMPKLLQKKMFVLANEMGERVVREISAMKIQHTSEIADILFVDNEARVVYGETTIRGADKSEFIDRLVNTAMSALGEMYQQEAAIASRQGGLPSVEYTMGKMKTIIVTTLQESNRL